MRIVRRGLSLLSTVQPYYLVMPDARLHQQRDMGGPAFKLKRAIDQGLTVGPRIYPSGAFISQTGGHGDFRMPYEIPQTIGGPLSHMEK